jgi:energy-coupling factor transport system permease protein
VSIALAFISPSLPWALAIGLILVVLMTYARVLVRFVPVAFGILLPIVILLLLVQGLANPANRTVIVALGPFSLYEEGIAAGLFTAARIFDLISATFLFSFTTRPADFSEALLQRGLSPRFGYVIQSALQIVPESLEHANRIRDAQQARGLETQGPLSRRVRAYIPLLLPLVLSSLVATQERAMALEVRGFGLPVHRYSRIVLPDSPGQRIFRWALVLLIPLAIAGRFLGWR